MTTTTHTPTPWTLGKGIVTIRATTDGDKEFIACTRKHGGYHYRDDDTCAANAAHIITCVNAHDAFVAVLRRICDDIATISEASRIARAALRDAGIAESGVAE